MKKISKLFISLLSAAMIAGCSTSTVDQEMTTGQMAPGETEVMDTQVILDAEVTEVMEAEEAIDNEINDLEAEEL